MPELGLCCYMGIFSSCGDRGLLSCCRAQALGPVDFSNSCIQPLEHWLSSCSSWAWLLCSMWDLPRLGIEPVPPASAGACFSTEPPGKPHIYAFMLFAIMVHHRILGIVPSALSRTLSFIYSIRSLLHLLIPNFQSIFPPHLSSLATTTLFSML